MFRGTVTSVKGTTVSVELEGMGGFSVGPIEAAVSDRAYRIGDRVLVADLGANDYAVVGRLP